MGMDLDTGPGHWCVLFLVEDKSGAGPNGASGAGGPASKKGFGAIPVVTAKARKGNIPVYLVNLGGVLPIYTVTVKSRVDGQLMSVHYKEGDMVQKGDPLIEIDSAAL